MNRSSLTDCDEVRLKLPAYIEGVLSEDETQTVDEHLKSCTACKELFEKSETRTVLGGKKPSSNEVQKMESKLTKRIAQKFLIICVLVFVAVYIILTALQQTLLVKPLFKKQMDIVSSLQDLVQFTIPGARIKSGWRGRIGIIDTINVIEYQQVLVGGVILNGRMDLAVPNYIGKNDWRVTSNTEPEDYSIQLIGFTNRQRNDNLVNSRWKNLDEVGKWSRSRIAITFEKPVSIAEMDEIVAKIGMTSDDLWFGLDTNGLNLNKWGYRGMSLIQAQWGFPLDMQLTEPDESSEKKDSDGNTISSTSVIKDSTGTVTSISRTIRLDEKHRVSQVMEDYRYEMKNFFECSKYFNDNEFSSDLKKVNDMIGKDDFKIAGFIIQDSTSNLLKLRDNRNIAGIEILKVDFDYTRWLYD